MTRHVSTYVAARLGVILSVALAGCDDARTPCHEGGDSWWCAPVWSSEPVCSGEETVLFEVDTPQAPVARTGDLTLRGRARESNDLAIRTLNVGGLPVTSDGLAYSRWSVTLPQVEQYLTEGDTQLRLEVAATGPCGTLSVSCDAAADAATATDSPCIQLNLAEADTGGAPAPPAESEPTAADSGDDTSAR